MTLYCIYISKILYTVNLGPYKKYFQLSLGSSLPGLNSDIHDMLVDQAVYLGKRWQNHRGLFDI